MPYASEADIADLHGAELLALIADTNGDGVKDAAAIARALDGASALIDGYLAARYRLPIASPPQLLRELCADIAIYRLARSPDLLSEDSRKRYEDALKVLRDVAAGRAAIGLPMSDPQGQGSAQDIQIEHSPRIFSRDSLRRL